VVSRAALAIVVPLVSGIVVYFVMDHSAADTDPGASRHQAACRTYHDALVRDLASPLDTATPTGVSPQVATQIIDDRSNFKRDESAEVQTYVVADGQLGPNTGANQQTLTSALAAWRQFVSDEISPLMTAGGC